MKSVNKYFFRVEYDGTAFGGWQRQKNAPSIQEALEKAFATAVRAPCRVTGAGRTDAGVHARAQGAHVEIGADIDIRETELSVNALLPPAVAVYRLQPVGDAFHARFSAVSRRYCYSMCPRKRPLLFRRVWMVFYEVDWKRVEEECASLLGTHDFSAFCASGSGARHARCTVTKAVLSDRGDCKVFTIEADRFVYMMVRSLIGTLIDIGRGRITTPLAALIAARDRKRAGTTAPACGLVLDNVFYEGVD
jgi:tRNA pseudouridine38-40 synthase